MILLTQIPTRRRRRKKKRRRRRKRGEGETLNKNGTFLNEQTPLLTYLFQCQLSAFVSGERTKQRHHRFVSITQNENLSSLNWSLTSQLQIQSFNCTYRRERGFLNHWNSDPRGSRPRPRTTSVSALTCRTPPTLGVTCNRRLCQLSE